MRPGLRKLWDVVVDIVEGNEGSTPPDLTDQGLGFRFKA